MLGIGAEEIRLKSQYKTRKKTSESTGWLTTTYEFSDIMLR